MQPREMFIFLAEEDIAVDACTPLDTFVNKVSDLPGYPSTNAEGNQ